MLNHGVGFGGLPTGSARALVRGPMLVWQNRLRGTELGVHDLTLPGYYAAPHWVRFAGAAGPVTVTGQGAGYPQLGQRLGDFPTTSVTFPATGIGFLNAIPAMGAKGQAAELTGPAGRPATAAGDYAGRLTFRF